MIDGTGVRVILLGPPGAGKGTQARRLAEHFNVPHIATGDIFRTAVAQKTPMGMAAKAYMDRGALVPDDVTIGIVRERLAQPDAARGFIMDGFPRTAAQATAFDALLAEMGRKLNAAIEVAVPRETLIKRLTLRRVCGQCQASYSPTAPPKIENICDRCGGQIVLREDDSAETAITRLDVYDRQTAPLLAYYQGAGLRKTVDGTKSIDDVYALMLGAIDAKGGVKAAS